jgi:hypothetical protein
MHFINFVVAISLGENFTFPLESSTGVPSFNSHRVAWKAPTYVCIFATTSTSSLDKLSSSVIYFPDGFK